MKILGLEITKSKASTKTDAVKYSENPSILFDSFIKGLSDADNVKVTKETFFEIYRRNGDVRGCVRKIAQTSALHGLYVEKNGKAKDFDYSIFSMPHFPTFADFKLRLTRDLKIGGEAYVVPVYNGLFEVVCFKFLDPRSIVKKFDLSGEIISFEQTINGRRVTIMPKDIAYFRLEPHTVNEVDGLSQLEGVVMDALTDKEAILRNYKFFVQGISADIAILLDKEVNADQLEIAREKLVSQLTGKENAHQPIISNGIKDIKQLSFSPKDIEFISQRYLTTDKVCANFDVPKSLLGYVEDVNRSNGETQKTQFVDNTIRPYETFLEFVFEHLYRKFVDATFGQDGTKIKCDGESTDDRERIEEGQRQDVERGILSIDEIREERGRKAWGTVETSNPLAVANIAPLSGREANSSKTSNDTQDQAKA